MAELTHRERWHRTFRYQSVDHVPDYEFGWWKEVYDVWRPQGLPEHVISEATGNEWFGFAPRTQAPVNVGPRGTATQVIEESERHRVIIDGLGVKLIEHKSGQSSIPHYLEFPITDRASWERFRAERLDPDDPSRYPSDADWEAWKQRVAERDYPLGIHCGSLFGRLRDWMGFEGISVACAWEPAFVEQMMEELCEFTLTVIERALQEVTFDFATFWEDMCFNKGSIISPKMFREWMTPRYKRITDRLHAAGVDIAYVDSDGNIGDLVPHWLEGGVNVMFPCEVRGGSDPIELRRRYGRDVLLMGGVDKTQLIAGRDAIVAEVERLAPLVEDGAFIPHVDHRCPPDVTYENYLFYLETKRRRFGIPDPPGWDAVRASADAAAQPTA